jgi:Ca-activated chloride channel family protein
LNESLLREIAGATPGGFYLPLRGATTMESLYEKGIGTLPKSETSEKLVRRYHERYHWPLAAAMILLLVEMLFPERKRERAKTTASAPAKAGLREAVALLALFVSLSAMGSPASALREYKSGKYDNALKDYQKSLEKKKDDPRLHFNAGAAAYKSKNFEEATKQFDEALNSPDLKLLQQSYYNRGNARFFLGESNPDPSKKSETWEEAAKDFESAMKLNAQDPDAKFNYEFVKKKLEELKQQQQQQKNDKNDQNKDDQDKDKQQQNKQDQDKKDQDKKDQQNKDQENKQDQAQQNKSDQNKDSQQQKDRKEQAQKDKEKKEKQSAEQKKKEQEKQQAEQSSGKPEDKDKQEGQQTYAAGQMTPQQAQQLLDAQKGQEMMLPVKPEGKPRDPSKPLRDW